MRKFIPSFIVVFLLCGSAAFLALAHFEFPLTGIDDADIYFVYAKNLVEGHGLVYNVGGERVEGFTSLLWTLVSAVVFKVSASPERTLFVLNVALVSVGISVLLQCLRSALPSYPAGRFSSWLWPGLFLALLLTSPRYLVWNTFTLMENGLWSTLLILSTVFVLGGQPKQSSINTIFIPLTVLLLLARPESVIWVIVFWGILFLRVSAGSGPGSAVRAMAPSAVVGAVTMASLTGFRIAYFGYPLPNTYYAKVSPSLAYNLQEGASYLARHILSDLLVLLSVIAITGLSIQTARRIMSGHSLEDGVSFLPIIAWVGLLMPLATGGDHFGAFRFYQNVFPIELTCLVFGVAAVWTAQAGHAHDSGNTSARSGLIRHRLFPLILLGLLLNQIYLWSLIRFELNHEFIIAELGRRHGTLIQARFSNLPRLPSLGVVTSGGIKFTYAGEVIDLMGLNNTIMAHNSGDRRGIKNHAAFDIVTFYRLQPDIVWPLTVSKADWKYDEMEVRESWENTRALRGLFDEPHFLEMYTYASVTRPTGPDSHSALVAWFRNDFLKELVLNPDYEIVEFSNVD